MRYFELPCIASSWSVSALGIESFFWLYVPFCVSAMDILAYHEHHVRMLI